MKRKQGKLKAIGSVSSVPSWAKGPYEGIEHQRAIGAIKGKRELTMYLLKIAEDAGAAGAVWRALLREILGSLQEPQPR